MFVLDYFLNVSSQEKDYIGIEFAHLFGIEFAHLFAELISGI